jgi:hypothetical protein
MRYLHHTSRADLDRTAELMRWLYGKGPRPPQVYARFWPVKIPPHDCPPRPLPTTQNWEKMA